MGQRLASEALEIEHRQVSECSPPQEDLRCIAVLERQANLIRDDSDAVYLPAHWNRQDAFRGAHEPYLDEAFATLEAPCFLDVQLHSCDPQQTRRAVRTTIEQLERRRPDTSSLKDDHLSHLRTLADALSGDPCGHLLIYAGSRDRNTALGLLRAFVFDAIGGSRFKVCEPQKGTSEFNRVIDTVGKLSHTFWDDTGWFSATLRDAVIKKPGKLSEGQIAALKAHSELAVLAGPDLIRDVLRSQSLDVVTCGPLETEIQMDFPAVVPRQTKGSIVIGVGLERGAEVVLPLEDITRHAFVAGVTGSGKTVTMFNILRQLGHQCVPFCLEPAKTEYRALAGFPDIKDRLEVYTPGRDNMSPLRINPFVFDSACFAFVTHCGFNRCFHLRT